MGLDGGEVARSVIYSNTYITNVARAAKNVKCDIECELSN